MSAHTKGPWEVHSFGEIDFSDPTELGLYEVVEANEEIGDLVRLGQYEKAREVMRANRALIKAAPKMRDGLARIVDLLAKGSDCDGSSRVCPSCIAISEARDLIALAEGRIRE